MSLDVVRAGAEWKPLEFGMCELRKAVNIFDRVPEEFNDRWTASELLHISRAYSLCAWTYAPHEWTEDQLRAAVRGETPPRWEEDETGHVKPLKFYERFRVEDKAGSSFGSFPALRKWAWSSFGAKARFEVVDGYLHAGAVCVRVVVPGIGVPKYDTIVGVKYEVTLP